MCRVCEDVAGKPPKQALAAIGAAVKAGESAEHFKKVMDKLLGTEEPQQDRERDAAWERNRRNRGGSDE